MKLKNLAVLVGLGLASTAAFAEDYDSRWYVSPMVGLVDNDSDRDIDGNKDIYAGIGFGRYIAPNSSLDLFFDQNHRDIEGNFGSWRSQTLGVALRHLYTDWKWRPYLKAGLGMSFHETNWDSGWDPVASVGVGLQRMFDDNALRLELDYRHDFDSSSIPTEDSFGDVALSASYVVPFGAKAAAAPAEPEAPKAEPEAPAETDHDKDGVLTVEDKCPDSPAGSVVGPDGCPQAITIDLRGVEFKFDRPKAGETAIEPTLNPNMDGMGILNNAVATLKQYPNLKVEVAGHTDWMGSDAYNQSLSQRRVEIVAEYLKSQGVNAEQLVGMMGYGESRPIDTNDTKEGRQRNRRTELNSQQ